MNDELLKIVTQNTQFYSNLFNFFYVKFSIESFIIYMIELFI